ncbi:MAG: hypothetical protein ACYTKD_01175 [Planctomycetota bacterium]|jgi:hypothetical protein
MRAKPVRRPRVPAYPTKLEVLAEPGLLENHVPAAWRATEDVAKALTVFLAAGLAGCEGAPPAPAAPAPVVDRDAVAAQPEAETPGADMAHVPARGAEETPSVAEHEAETAPSIPEHTPVTPVDPQSDVEPPARAVVAPIFEHGEGRGATGCVVVSPPVFLSEEEALQIITEELAANGVKMPERDLVLKGVAVSPRVYERGPEEPREKARLVEDKEAAGPLELDATDAGGEIAVEFVSRQDYSTLGGANPGRGRIASKPIVNEDGTISVSGGGWGSSVSEYDFKDAAGWVSKAVASQGPGLYFGAFYDPMTYTERAWSSGRKALSKEERDSLWEKAKADAAARSRALLREQVKDFVEWLKGQGVI